MCPTDYRSENNERDAGSLSRVVPLLFFLMNNALSLSLRKAGEITFPHPKGTGLWVFAYRFLFVSTRTDLRAGHTGLVGRGWDFCSFNPILTLSLGRVQYLCSHSVYTVKLNYHHGCGALSYLPRGLMFRWQGLRKWRQRTTICNGCRKLGGIGNCWCVRIGDCLTCSALRTSSGHYLILVFCQQLGVDGMILHCDNEPSLVSLQELCRKKFGKKSIRPWTK